MKQATQKQWEALFEVTRKFEKERPWEQFEDMELFGLKIPGHKDKFYCSIMGFHQNCYGLAIYTGKAGLDAIAAMVNQLPMTAQEYISFDTGWMVIYFDSPDQLTELQEDARIKAGLDLTHPEVYVVLESHCFPSDPNQKEVLLLTEIVSALIEALEYFYSLKIDFNFNDYVFVYDAEKKKHRKQKLTFELHDYPLVLIDPDIVEELDKGKRNHEVWGMDLVYLNEGIDRADERTVRCKGFFVENRTRDMLIEGTPLNPDEEMDTLIDIIIDLLKENGIPSKIVVRNPHMMAILIALCKTLNIALEVQDDFEMVDELLEMIIQNEMNPQN